MNFRTLEPTFLGLAVFSLAIPGPAQDGAKVAEAVTHTVLVAGPNFTGVIGSDGKPTWEAPKKAARDAFALENGHLLISWKKEVVEFDRERNPVWTYELDPANGEIGTAARLAGGVTLVAELGAKPRLVEVGSDGEILAEVKLEPETANVHMQTRMARKLANGHYLVPHLLAFSVKEYAPSGEVVAEFRTDTERFGGREAKNWPFTAIRTPEGNTVVGCTYGNRVVEFDADGEVVWELTNEDVGGIIKDACGVQRLPNGNTVVACYGKKKGVKLFEVNRAKEVVWTYEGPHRVHHFQVLTTNGQPVAGPPMK